MGNIRPYGRPKGRNHVGIYLFETISEQVFSASAGCIENAAVRQSMQRPPPVIARRSIAISRP